MGYRGGPTPGGEQGPSFYYPGSHRGSQPSSLRASTLASSFRRRRRRRRPTSSSSSSCSSLPSLSPPLSFFRFRIWLIDENIFYEMWIFLSLCFLFFFFSSFFFVPPFRALSRSLFSMERTLRARDTERMR